MLEHRNLEDLNLAFHRALKQSSKQMKKDEPKLLGGHGPVWARDYAYGRGSSVCEMASEVLKKVDADRMVVGHTIQRDFQVHSKCHGHIILGDTAISSAYGGAMSFVEYGTEGHDVKVVYPATDLAVALPEIGMDQSAGRDGGTANSMPGAS